MKFLFIIFGGIFVSARYPIVGGFIIVMGVSAFLLDRWRRKMEEKKDEEFFTAIDDAIERDGKATLTITRE